MKEKALFNKELGTIICEYINANLLSKEYHTANKKPKSDKKNPKSNRKTTSTDVITEILRMSTTELTDEDIDALVSSMGDYSICEVCSIQELLHPDSGTLVGPLRKLVYITVSNSAKLAATGIGAVTLLLEKRPVYTDKSSVKHNRQATEFTFLNVLYCPQLMAYLLSSAQLAKVSFSTVVVGRRIFKPANAPLKKIILDANTNDIVGTMTYHQQQYFMDVDVEDISSQTLSYYSHLEDCLIQAQVETAHLLNTVDIDDGEEFDPNELL
ncbi:hypothetical protein BJ508DRAFT_331235 [Ascobolus immersus RN42]|uniref:Uncharacterized protein n=1 Tax=Ascobolus immersus RN42 TaxID=1160509 RepID=A0A3N4HWN5_ASCIM|nr:hypothetical protein BJ508DRAFT_331235 [Ascobolus immersus RN42]